MTLGFFSNHDQEKDGNKHRAILTLQSWLNGKSHLPKDLIKALKTLVPELREKGEDDW